METRKDIKEIKKVEEKPQQINLKDMDKLNLESLAFRIGEQIKNLQRQYNEVYTELLKRQQGGK